MLKEAGELAAQLKGVVQAIKAQRESNEVRRLIEVAGPSERRTSSVYA